MIGWCVALISIFALPLRALAGAAPDSSATAAPRLHHLALAAPAPDRLLHGSLSLSLGLGIGLCSQSSAAAFGGAVTLGALKEWRDSRRTKFDPVDLVFDIAGAALAALVTRGLTR